MWGRPDLALGPVLADPSGLVGLNATHVPATPRPVSSSDLPLELGLRHRVACSALVSPPQRPAAATHSLFELRVQILLLPLPLLTAPAAPAGPSVGPVGSAPTACPTPPASFCLRCRGPSPGNHHLLSRRSQSCPGWAPCDRVCRGGRGLSQKCQSHSMAPSGTPDPPGGPRGNRSRQRPCAPS